MLDTQAEIAKGDNTFAIRQLQREVKKELQTKLNGEEINNLCQLQNEITRLQGQELETQIEIPSK